MDTEVFDLFFDTSVSLNEGQHHQNWCQNVQLNNTEPGIAKEKKKRKYLGRSRGMLPPENFW